MKGTNILSVGDVQSRQAPALINTCHDAQFAPHVRGCYSFFWVPSNTLLARMLIRGV
jgi:hypothetical protein